MTYTPKVKTRLVLPHLKIPEYNPKGDTLPIYVKPLAKVFKGKPQPAKEGKKAQDPADLCNVVNLATGEEMQMIVPAVVMSVWTEDMKGEYVGKGFAITKGPKPDGKRYHTYLMDEIEV